MTCFGSKSISSRKTKTCNPVENSQMAGEENISNWDGKKKKKNRRPVKEHQSYHGDHPTENSSRMSYKNVKSHVPNHQDVSKPEFSVLRLVHDSQLNFEYLLVWLPPLILFVRASIWM